MSPSPAPSPSKSPATPRHLWWAGVALVLGLVLVSFFGWRAWKQIQYAQKVESGEIAVSTLRGWMTLAYVEKVYGVPQAESRQALGLPATGSDDRSLHDWFVAAGVTPEAGRKTIEALILAHRAPPATAGSK